MLIRAARIDDGSALIPLFTQWGHELSVKDANAILTAWHHTPCAEFLLAEMDGSVAGKAAVSANLHFGRPGPYARLAGLVVAATHRRCGVGAALLDVVEEQARSWACDRVELTSS